MKDVTWKCLCQICMYSLCFFNFVTLVWETSTNDFILLSTCKWHMNRHLFHIGQKLYISYYGQTQNILRISFRYKTTTFSFTDIFNVSAGSSTFFQEYQWLKVKNISDWNYDLDCENQITWKIFQCKKNRMSSEAIFVFQCWP